MTVLDPATGRIRWQHDLADVLIAARVVLTDERVAFTSFAGVLHVLDRRDGHEVRTVAPRRLGGLPVATVAAPAAGARECSWPSGFGSGGSSCGIWREGLP